MPYIQSYNLEEFPVPITLKEGYSERELFESASRIKENSDYLKEITNAGIFIPEETLLIAEELYRASQRTLWYSLAKSKKDNLDNETGLISLLLQNQKILKRLIEESGGNPLDQEEERITQSLKREALEFIALRDAKDTA